VQWALRAAVTSDGHRLGTGRIIPGLFPCNPPRQDTPSRHDEASAECALGGIGRIRSDASGRALAGDRLRRVRQCLDAPHRQDRLFPNMGPAAQSIRQVGDPGVHDHGRVDGNRGRLCGSLGPGESPHSQRRRPPRPSSELLPWRATHHLLLKLQHVLED
jgi:hypothetical protein